MQRITLFCLPYSGGSSAVFAPWKQQLDTSIQVMPIELSGRGSRFGEPLYETVDAAVQDILPILTKKASEGPYAIFGHSMGCMLTFELTRRIQAQGIEPPTLIILSGRSAPQHTKSPEDFIHGLPDSEFAKRIFEMGGMSEEILQNQSFLHMFLPIIRADYKLSETYQPRDLTKLDVDFAVFYGKADPTRLGEASEWAVHTSKSCQLFSFNGGHFFINTESKAVLKEINQLLLEQLRIHQALNC